MTSLLSAQRQSLWARVQVKLTRDSRDIAFRLPTACLLALVAYSPAYAQIPLSQRPEFKKYAAAFRLQDALDAVSREPIWDADGAGLTYADHGTPVHLTISGLVKTPGSQTPTEKMRVHTPEQMYRGPQIARRLSPNGKLRVLTRDDNIFIQTVPGQTGQGSSETQVTTDGSRQGRIRYGTASWVYREELDVSQAMWWSPDSTKVAFYRFDESKVRDYYVATNQSSIQDSLSVEPYPLAGASNPVVSLLVYDVATHKTAPVKSDFDDPELAEYLYDVRWSPDGRSLLFNRANRKQNVMQLCAADPDTGIAHKVVQESEPQSWVELHPEMRFLSDGQRFLWATEGDGFKNYRLIDLSGRDWGAVTHNRFDAIVIDKLDETSGTVYYTSYGAENPYRRQLHRVGLDGSHDTQLTDGSLDHVTSIAPDNRHFADLASSVTSAPELRLLDDSGGVVEVLTRADPDLVAMPHAPPAEEFQFLADDAKTVLYGRIQFPSDFNPRRRYPVLLDVYAGPESDGIGGEYRAHEPACELGFLVVSVAGRGTFGRGKAFRDAIYEKLGVVEIDDQAAGIRSLAQRRYVDEARVGAFGTSYGGYATIMCLLRHPEVFSVGCASSSVTSWRDYDSIYTERYDGLPTSDDNAKGYDAGSAMTYAKNLRGHLMLYFGSADDNVHPANTLQLIRALDEAKRPYDLNIGTDEAHSEMNRTRMWEYFLAHLIDAPDRR